MRLGELGGGILQRPVPWRQRHAGLPHSAWGKPRCGPASLLPCAAAQHPALAAAAAAALDLPWRGGRRVGAGGSLGAKNRLTPRAYV